MGESAARCGAVGDFQTLPGAGKERGVLADDIATANRREADRALGARSGEAFAAGDRSRLKVHAASGGHGLADGQRGAGRGIDLVPMMGLDHLQIGVRVHGAGGQFHQAQHKIDPGAEIRGLTDRNPRRGPFDGRLLRRVQPGGAKHPGHARLAQRRGMRDGGGGGGEVDQHLRARERAADIVSVQFSGHAARRLARGRFTRGRLTCTQFTWSPFTRRRLTRARCIPGQLTRRRFARSQGYRGQLQRLAGLHQVHQSAPHAPEPAGNGHANAHRRTLTASYRRRSF